MTNTRHALKDVPNAGASNNARRFSVAGMEISVIVTGGTKRPVVFVHGNSSNKTIWDNQIDLLRNFDCPVLALDLPGHGESENSPTPETTYSFPGYAAIVSRLLDALDWSSVSVVGWSLGGHIGLELLARDPRLHSLLIVGTPPVTLCIESLQQAFYCDAGTQLAGKATFSDLDARAYGEGMLSVKHLTPFLLDGIRRTDGNARRVMFENLLKGFGEDERRLVESCPKSLCVVHGENDRFVRLKYLRSLKYRALWNDRIYVIKETGHAPHWEQPIVFNEILLKFLGLTM